MLLSARTQTETKALKLQNHLSQYLPLQHLVVDALAGSRYSMEKTYIAGGAIRNAWLNYTIKDVDIFFNSQDIITDIKSTLDKYTVYNNDLDKDDDEVVIVENEAPKVIQSPGAKRTVADFSFFTSLSTKANYQSFVQRKDLNSSLIDFIQEYINKNYQDYVAQLEQLNSELTFSRDIPKIVEMEYSFRGNINIYTEHLAPIQLILERCVPISDVAVKFDFTMNTGFFTFDNLYIPLDLEKANSAEDVLLVPCPDPETPDSGAMRVTYFAMQGYQYNAKSFLPFLEKIKKMGPKIKFTGLINS